MTALQRCQLATQYRRQYETLCERLAGLQGMVSTSAPPIDKECTSGGHSAPDKIGEYVALSEDTRADMIQVRRRLRSIADMISGYLDGLQRQVIHLHYIAGLSTRSIAARLDVSQSTVSRYKRQGEDVLQSIDIS